MSTARNLADELEEETRLDGLGIVDDERMCRDISTVLEKRGEINLRYAILTVIDDGDPTLEGKPWALFHAFEDTANEARLRFVDAVIAQLK